MLQIIQIAGALLILTAFALSQIERLDLHSVVYLVLNLAGSVILAILAYVEAQWGFLLLEGVWALLSGRSLFFILRARSRSAPS